MRIVSAGIYIERKNFRKYFSKSKIIHNLNFLKFFKYITYLTTFQTKWLLNYLALKKGNNFFSITPFYDSARSMRTSIAHFYVQIQAELIVLLNVTTVSLIKHFKARILFRLLRFRTQTARLCSGIGHFLKTVSSLEGSGCYLLGQRLMLSTRRG